MDRPGRFAERPGFFVSVLAGPAFSRENRKKELQISHLFLGGTEKTQGRRTAVYGFFTDFSQFVQQIPPPECYPTQDKAKRM